MKKEYVVQTVNKSGKVLKEFKTDKDSLDISKKKLTGTLKTDFNGHLNCSNNKLKRIIANNCIELNCENNELVEIVAEKVEVLNCNGNIDLFVLENMTNLKILNGEKIK